jgi:hypothetical protein
MRYRSILGYPLGIAHVPEVPLGATGAIRATGVVGASDRTTRALTPHFRTFAGGLRPRPACPDKPAFLFRDIPVNERQLGKGRGQRHSGVRFPLYPGVNERQLHWTPGRADPSLAVAAHQPTHIHSAVRGERRSEPAVRRGS